MHFGTKYIKAQLYIILSDCAWKLVFKREGFGEFENPDLQWCLLLHFGHKYITGQIYFIQPLWLELEPCFLRKGFQKIRKSGLEILHSAAFWPNIYHSSDPFYPASINGALSFWREGLGKFENLDLKWCILVHFGKMYQSSDSAFMIGDGTLSFLDGKVLENFETLDLKWCILVDFGTISIKPKISIIFPLLTGLGPSFWRERF